MAQKQKMVYLEYSETLSFDESKHADAQLLKGNVRFRHEDALMYCDSAYYYEKTNSFDAFGHVRFVQGDTLQGFSDVLYYDGNKRIARLRHNVRLIHTTTTLTTDSMNYDRNNDLAYYFSGGKIVDNLNTLTSKWGQYNPATRLALFKDDVLLTHPQFTIDADTLTYNTFSNVANIVGPTIITYKEETKIYSTRGWYNTQSQESMLLNRSMIEHTNGKTLTGDTIFYNKLTGYGQILRNMQMTDSVQKMTLSGNYGEAYENERSGFATDSALLIDWSQDDWLYLHADSLYTEEVAYTQQVILHKDSIMVDSVLIAQTPDTLWNDTTYRQARAFHNVRLYHIDAQAVCDSMCYNFRDSVMMLRGNPVAWSEDQQVSADSINIYMKEGKVDYAHGVGNALGVKQESINQFDQMAGKEMKAFVKDNQLVRVDVEGNAETIFFPRDNGEIIGVNRTQSSYVKIFLENQKIHHILFTSETTGTMYPLKDATDDIVRLPGFFWAGSVRPLVPMDVFLNTGEITRPKQSTISATDNNSQNQPKSRKEKNRQKKVIENKR